MIDKLDIEILDKILDVVIESNSMINYRRFDEYEHFNYLSDEKRKLEFQRLIDYFENYNCADIIKHGCFNSLDKNQITQRFKNNGGFGGKYQEELKLIKRVEERDKLETELAISNLEANALNKAIADKNDKNERKNTIGMWVNIIIGVLNIVLIVIQICLSLQKP